MDTMPATAQLSTPLPRPPIGGSSRVRCGAAEVVLESTRAGSALVWFDGRDAKRFVMGLPRDGHLTLELRAPRLPLHVATREVVALSARGRVRGYVQVPLVPTVVFHPPIGADQLLLELPARDLAPEWDDREGTVFRVVSSLHVRFPMRTGEPRATVPVRIGNPTAGVASPAWLPVVVRDAELRALRGSIVTAPRRLHWNGDALVVAKICAKREAVG